MVKKPKLALQREMSGEVTFKWPQFVSLLATLQFVGKIISFLDGSDPEESKIIKELVLFRKAVGLMDVILEHERNTSVNPATEHAKDHLDTIMDARRSTRSLGMDNPRYANTAREKKSAVSPAFLPKVMQALGLVDAHVIKPAFATEVADAGYLAEYQELLQTAKENPLLEGFVEASVPVNYRLDPTIIRTMAELDDAEFCSWHILCDGGAGNAKADANKELARSALELKTALFGAGFEVSDSSAKMCPTEILRCLATHKKNVEPCRKLHCLCAKAVSLNPLQLDVTQEHRLDPGLFCIFMQYCMARSLVDEIGCDEFEVRVARDRYYRDVYSPEIGRPQKESERIYEEIYSRLRTRISEL